MPPDRFGLVALGGQLSVEALLQAYRSGVFPWSGESPIPWYSPDPRMVLAPEAFRRRRSLTKSIRRQGFEVVFDQDFEATMRACAQTFRPGQGGTWITESMIEVYGQLHALGFAHSVEVRVAGRLVGGLYGLSLGRAFFGESMFSRARDSSKAALQTLCAHLAALGFDFIDCQAYTPHLASLGAEPIPRQAYLLRLARALESPTLQSSWAELPAWAAQRKGPGIATSTR